MSYVCEEKIDLPHAILNMSFRKGFAAFRAIVFPPDEMGDSMKFGDTAQKYLGELDKVTWESLEYCVKKFWTDDFGHNRIKNTLSKILAVRIVEKTSLLAMAISCVGPYTTYYEIYDAQTSFDIENTQPVGAFYFVNSRTPHITHISPGLCVIHENVLAPTRRQLGYFTQAIHASFVPYDKIEDPEAIAHLVEMYGERKYVLDKVRRTMAAALLSYNSVNGIFDEKFCKFAKIEGKIPRGGRSLVEMLGIPSRVGKLMRAHFEPITDLEAAVRRAKYLP